MKNLPASYRDKDLIVFDLDGTLTPSKSNLEPDMSAALTSLLQKKKVAVIGGGTYRQFKKQFVAELKCPKSLLPKLFLFPTTATSFYRYQKGWKNIYSFTLSKNEWHTIRKAFADTLREIHYIAPKKTYGKVLENRGTQVTFSALGQDVVAVLGKRGLRLKEEWKSKNTPLKLKIARIVQKKLPNLEVHPSAFTSIDITKKGIDKAYGVRQIKKTLKIPIGKMLFVGDALYRGGNDAAAKRTGIDCMAVKGPAETKEIIEKLI
jgi:phosphomannomutase